MAIGGFLHAEGFSERCSQLIPLLPHHHTLIGDKFTTIHHLIGLHLVPEPLQKAPHVLAEVELLMGIEASPRHQAEVFARRDVDRVLGPRIVVGNHRRSAVEGSHRQDQVQVGVDQTQTPVPVASGNYMPLPLRNSLLCDFMG